jgi:hypothetical protein
MSDKKHCVFWDGNACDHRAEFNVIGETVSCFFDIVRPGHENKAEFCEFHANIERARRQAQTPVRP